MSPRKTLIHLATLGALGLLAPAAPAAAQDYGARMGDIQRGGEVSFQPQGPGVLHGALDPAVRRWYVPQELFNEYRWRQWDYSNYARDHYQRYVSVTREGDFYYDLYGNFVTKGWLIFNNSQTQPKQFGSSVLKSANFSRWFDGVLISSDSKGQHHYALTMGAKIRTTLTPMTFSKPQWDGVQFDYASDKYQGTVLYSRLSRTGGSSTNDQESLVTNLTSLVGGRGTVQVGDFATLGLTAVNSHQSNTLIDGFTGNPISGELTVDQNKTLSLIEVILRDDSPEDGGGASFFPAGSDIIITFDDGSVDRGKQIGFAPVIEGGFERDGYLAADGPEEIRLRYNFDSPGFVNHASGSKEEIVGIEFRYVLGNDYQVWMTSDNQLNQSEGNVALLVTQAEGNVQDNTNLRIVSFEYGLPTATQIWGATLELKKVAGFDVYGEYDLSYNYRKYPSVVRKGHRTASGIRGDRAAEAWMVNISRNRYPWFAWGELYSMHPRYSTSTYVAQGDGFIDYEDKRIHVVELVEDNDDQDQFPDTVRKDWQAGDPTVFPGWDENNDFISDFNQNDNRFISNSIPDYDEPFLRHNVDRPEFLYGVDLNNNFWIDRFENDEEPDYPYRRDHQGFNLYGGVNVTPDVRVSVGILREGLISSNQRNNADYALLSIDRDIAGWGRFRLFDMIKSVKDDIPNELVQWLPNANIRTGEATKIEDLLLARDAIVNSLWAGHAYDYRGLKTDNFLKWDLFQSRLDAEERSRLSQRQTNYFFGVINRVSYRFDVGRLRFEPRWKSIFRHQTIDVVSNERKRSLTELGGLLVGFPLLRSTDLQAGLELTLHNDMLRDSRDFRGVVGAVQFTNLSAYLGYGVTTQLGMQIDRQVPKVGETLTINTIFLSAYAGIDL